METEITVTSPLFSVPMKEYGSMGLVLDTLFYNPALMSPEQEKKGACIQLLQTIEYHHHH